jgi:hypothetical protein
MLASMRHSTHSQRFDDIGSPSSDQRCRFINKTLSLYCRHVFYVGIYVPLLRVPQSGGGSQKTHPRFLYYRGRLACYNLQPSTTRFKDPLLRPR